MSCERLIPRHTRAPGFLPGIRQSINQSVTHSLTHSVAEPIAYSRPCFGTRARIVPEIITSPLLLSSSVGPIPSLLTPNAPPLGTLRHRNLPLDFLHRCQLQSCHHVIDLQLLSVNTTIVSRVSIAPPHGHSHQYFLFDVAFMALPHVSHGCYLVLRY